MQSALPPFWALWFASTRTQQPFHFQAGIIFFILLFKEKKPQAIFLQLAKYSYVSVSCKKELERKHTNSRLGQIHTNVTVNVQNIMCHCFSPPAPNKLLKTHFIHRITVLAVYLINMTTQRTQDFFQFPSFAFSHFRQKEQKVTTVFYFFCQYAIIYMSWFNRLTKIDSKPIVRVSAAVFTFLWSWKKKGGGGKPLSRAGLRQWSHAKENKVLHLESLGDFSWSLT